MCKCLLSSHPRPASCFRMNGGLLPCHPLTVVVVGAERVEQEKLEEGWSSPLSLVPQMSSWHGIWAPRRGMNIPHSSNTAPLLTTHGLSSHIGQGLPASALCVFGTQFMCILSNIMHIPILETSEPKLGNWRGIAGKESFTIRR